LKPEQEKYFGVRERTIHHFLKMKGKYCTDCEKECTTIQKLDCIHVFIVFAKAQADQEEKDNG